MACCWALMKEVDKAILNITKAINAGWTGMSMLKIEKRLKNIHIDQR